MSKDKSTTQKFAEALFGRDEKDMTESEKRAKKKRKDKRKKRNSAMSKFSNSAKKAFGG